MPRRCHEFVDSRLRRSPPDRASAVPYGQAGENAMRFPRLAHRSAAAHKLHSTPQQDRMNLISGKSETISRLPALAYSPRKLSKPPAPSHYTYVYLVENVREEGRTKQRIIANLGRKEVVVARGDLDRLARSVVRLAQRSMVLSLVEGEAPPNARCQRIGPALLFERLWHEVGCRAVLEELAAGRQFEFAAER